MRTSELHTTCPPVEATEPYVGLRPSDRHERHLIFGRDRDAQFLLDKVFAASLTVFYGQSGLGKSSILRALLIPRLEEADALVLQFDAWSSETPTASLKHLLVEK